MAINVSVQYNGGLLPDIILLAQGYYHRGTRFTEKDGQDVASKGHRRDKIENINKNTQTVETN